jgi:hypothetical protein
MERNRQVEQEIVSFDQDLDRLRRRGSSTTRDATLFLA